MNRGVFRIVLLKDAKIFLHSLSRQVYKKILSNAKRIERGEKNAELFKKLEDTNIWELRTLYEGKAYRLFAFWDKDGEILIVCTHGIIKKTQKTPVKEIAKAEAIRKDYFRDKKREK